MRPRMKVKVGLQGSSDFNRVLHKNRCLEKAHEEFIHTDLFAKVGEIPLSEPSPDTLVRPWNPFKRCFDSMRIPYKVAKSAGCKWSY